MNQQRHLDFLRRAQAEGVLPESATLPQTVHVPWPVLLMTTIGAWMATIPLVAFLHMASSGALAKGSVPIFLGIILLATGLFLLRSADRSLFAEQFILAALVLVGFVHLGLGLYEGPSKRATYFLMSVVATGVAWALPRRWLQSIFGAIACFLLLHAAGRWQDAYLALGGWALLCMALPLVRGDTASRIDAISAGWAAVLLIALAVSGGATSFFTASFAHGLGGAGEHFTPTYSRLTGVFLTFAAAGLAGYRWSSLVKPRFIVVAVIAAGLAWLMPGLGGILLILAYCATSGRYILAGTAAVAAVFLFSAFYYLLDLPLVTKAAIFVAAGTTIGATVWLAQRSASARPQSPPGHWQAGSASILGGMLIVLAGINFSIWQKERLIRHGDPVLVELAPVDPRSLLQGDYMALRFATPALATAPDTPIPSQVIGQRDERGVTRLTRYDDGRALKPGEFKIDLIRKNGGLTLVTDAWYFAEGDAKRWEAARYGEFRVDPSGKALLVGMRDEKLRPIR